MVRLTGVWEPREDFQAKLKLFKSRSKQNDAGRTVLYACADGPGANPFYLGFPDPTQVCPDSEPKLRRNGALPPASVADAHPFIDADSRFNNTFTNETATLELTWDFGNFTLTSLTG